MNADEQRVVDLYRAFLDRWFSRDQGGPEQLLDFLHESFHGMGTAGHEIFRSKSEMIEQFEREFEQLPNGGDVTVALAEARSLGDDTYGVLSEITVRVQYQHGQALDLGPIRISSIWKREGDEYQVVQWHSSFPDASGTEEVFPGSREPKRYEEITIFLTDFVGFTGSVSTLPPKRLVSELNDIFSAFDEITKQHGVDKIKTIGDAYMAACGLEDDIDDHAVRVVRSLKAMLAYLEERNERSALKWQMRAGVHSGPAVGGIIGRERLTFDLWGDTVNLASRMESSGEPGQINVSAYTYDLVRDAYPCTYRGRVDTKDRGKMDMYFVD